LSLPPAFCWSKFGTEAGESSAEILMRKEVERAQNGGVFLWGIGSSIEPSLRDLLVATESPKVFFSPMISRPAVRDVHPIATASWHSAVGLDGEVYEIPRHSLVTSRIQPNQPKRRHFALVCRSEQPIDGLCDETWIDHLKLRNLRTGARVGASQVTSVVQRINDSRRETPRYRVAFQAVLDYPYFVSLTEWMPVSGRHTQ
jgi:hypothetical protein